MSLIDIIGKKRILASLAVIALVAPVSALAAPITGPITGAIGFGGLFTPTGGTGLNDATGISIGFATVTSASGDFAPTLNTGASYASFVFSSTPVAPLWSVGGFSFDLASLSIDLQNSSQLNLSGAGTLSGNGFDDTPGQWTFSGQQGNSFFTFSGITSADSSPVSEPITLGLMMSGLLGLGLSRRRNR